MKRYCSVDRRVVACIPHYKCKQYIRKAVDSLLDQIHRELLIVVVNDGDKDPPWDELASIQDKRLIRFELTQNHGPFFATSVVLHACDAPYLLIQDADDWSDSRRVSLLLAALERDQSSFAVSGQSLYTLSEGSLHLRSIRWTESSIAPSPPRRFMVNPCITPEFQYRAPHHGLFRCHALRDVGAYYAGLTLSYDRLVTNLLLMTGRISHVATPLYFRLIRENSLTHSPGTAWNSEKGIRESEKSGWLYTQCFGQYEEHRAGRLPLTALLSYMKNITHGQLTTADRSELESEVTRLRALLKEGRTTK